MLTLMISFNSGFIKILVLGILKILKNIIIFKNIIESYYDDADFLFSNDNYHFSYKNIAKILYH